MADITKEQLDELTKSMEAIAPQAEGSEDLMQSLATILALPDEQFDILAPGLLESYARTFNNPNDKLAIAQSLNATGYKAEDVNAAFEELIQAVDKTNLTAAKRDFLKQMFGFVVSAVNETEGISKRFVSIPIELCHPDAKIPQYAHTSDAGADVFAVEDTVIHPGETKLVPTGLKLALPPGYELQVRMKSGRTLRSKWRIANAVGTIDQGYRDEIKVLVENIEPPIKDIEYDQAEDGTITIKSILHGSDYTITKGEKFCQFILAESPKASFIRVDAVKDIGEDRQGGFGSTD